MENIFVGYYAWIANLIRREVGGIYFSVLLSLFLFSLVGVGCFRRKSKLAGHGISHHVDASQSVDNIREGPVLIIEAGKTEGRYWSGLWRYRELFYFLAWRDILVRYKQTVIGVAWALIRPLLTMIVFSIHTEHKPTVMTSR